MQPSVRTRRGASRPADASASEALRGTSQAGGRHAGGRGGSDLAAGSARPVRPYWRQWPAWVGYAAAIWSAVYGALGVYWATGGAGFPFGVGHDPSAHLSVLAGARPAIAAPAIALLGLLGVVVGVTIARASGRGPERVALLVLAWAFAAGLALVIPDARVLALAAYAPLLVIGPLFGWSPSVRFVDAMSWPLVNQTVCVSGGLLWAAAATVYQRRTNRACPHCGRADRSASWTRPQAAARWGRWAVVIAAVVPPLYAVSRLAWALGIPLGISNAMLRAGQAEGNGVLGAPFGLACVAIGGAVLTLGLTRPWGEVFPRWPSFRPRSCPHSSWRPAWRSRACGLPVRSSSKRRAGWAPCRCCSGRSGASRSPRPRSPTTTGGGDDASTAAGRRVPRRVSFAPPPP